MKSNYFLFLFNLLFVTVLRGQIENKQQVKPNVLFLQTDQHV